MTSRSDIRTTERNHASPVTRIFT